MDAFVAVVCRLEALVFHQELARLDASVADEFGQDDADLVLRWG